MTNGTQPTDRQDELSLLRDSYAASEKAALASRDVDWMKVLIFIMSSLQGILITVVGIMVYFTQAGIVENRQAIVQNGKAIAENREAIVENREAIAALTVALTEHHERYRHTER